MTTASGLGKAKHSQERGDALALSVFQQYWRDPFFLVGLALYWGEGRKARMALGNTDPALMRTFVEWVRRYIPHTSLTLAVKYAPGADLAMLKAFWEDETGITVQGFSPSKNTRHANGVAAVAVIGLKDNQHFTEKLLQLFKEWCEKV